MGEYAFRPEIELQDIGEYKPVPKMYGMPGRAARKFNSPITPKENFLRIARKESPFRRRLAVKIISFTGDSVTSAIISTSPGMEKSTKAVLWKRSGHTAVTITPIR